jgi:hypothetical protein
VERKGPNNSSEVILPAFYPPDYPLTTACLSALLAEGVAGNKQLSWKSERPHQAETAMYF